MALEDTIEDVLAVVESGPVGHGAGGMRRR
jgi:hypothetical protein